MSIMENREEVLLELTRFESARQSPDIPQVLEEYLKHVARTGDSVFPWPKVRPLLKRKLDLIADQFCQHCPPEKIPAMPNVDPFKYDQLRTEIHFRIDSLNGTPFTIQRLCELMTEPQRYYKRTDKFMRGVEKNVLVVTTIEATRRRPPPEAMNGAAGPEEAGVAMRGVPSTSGAGRPPEPPAGQTTPAAPAPAPAADEAPSAVDVVMETNGETPADELASPADPSAVTSDNASPGASDPADAESAMAVVQSAATEASETPAASEPDLTTSGPAPAASGPAARVPEPSEPAAAAAPEPAEPASEPAASEPELKSADEPATVVNLSVTEPAAAAEQQAPADVGSAGPPADDSATPVTAATGADSTEPGTLATAATESLPATESHALQSSASDPAAAAGAGEPTEPAEPARPEEPAEQSAELTDSLESSSMSLDDSLCGSDAAAGSPPAPAADAASA